MKTRFQIQSKAFTLVEALIVVAVLLLLVALMLPRMASVGHTNCSMRIKCLNGLKQVGLAARIWSGDNGDRFPMSVSTNQGGSMELTLGGDAVLAFRVMSNELCTPKVLICPTDCDRNAATNFLADFNRTNISYFVGVDATETNATMLLSGDRNITNGTRLRGGLLELTTNRLSGWTGEIHQNVGNLLMADGSVQQVSTPGLRMIVENTGIATNRLALP